LLGVSERTVRRWRREKRIRAIKIGRVVRFRASDVLADKGPASRE